MKQGEMLCTTTIKLNVKSKVGDVESHSSGTGFFYAVEYRKNDYIPCVITNKHVIQNWTTITLTVSIANTEGLPLNQCKEFTLNYADGLVINHSMDNIDLCAISLLSIIEELKSVGIEIHTYYLTSSIFLSKEELNNLDAIEEILMIGYPNAIIDPINNMPIVRKGITATNPKLNFGGNSSFLVDMAVYPGSSGSPIFYLDKSYKTEITKGITGHKVYLLGVISSVYAHTINDQYKLITPNNLGIAIKAENILDIEKLILSEVNSSMS